MLIMGNNLKSGLGYLIPLGAVVGFVFAILTGNYLLSIMFPLAGILTWFLYMIIMQITVPDIIGNIIIGFGGLLTVGIFLVYGIETNIFGGFELSGEGTVFAFLVLFFSILTGMLFNRDGSARDDLLTGREKELIDKAIESSKDEENPKVIVIKQEQQPQKEKDNQQEERTPYYAYPPGYDYYDDYYEDEYEDEEDEEE